jgi:hypothetical protein
MTGLTRCAHRLRTDALPSLRRSRRNPARAMPCDLQKRTIPTVTDRSRHGRNDTANAVWVNSPSGVQIPEPPPLNSGFPRRGSAGGPLLSRVQGSCAHNAASIR